MRSALLVMGLVAGCGGSQAAAPGAEPLESNGPQLWMQVAGHGDPTVVFEAGGGDDSSVWAAIEPEVRDRLGVRTVVYDRAGLGKSAPAPGPYRIDDEAAALARSLDRFGVRGPIVVVAHSYGGFIAQLLAARDPRVVGAVLVDANLVAFFDDAEVAYLEAKEAPRLAALERADPARARVLIPLTKAYPDTVKRLRAVAFPPALPTIDIVAEHSWGDTEEQNAAMRRVHAAFVAASPARTAVFAAGSSHDVMHDKPAIVIDAIGRLLRTIHAPSS